MFDANLCILSTALLQKLYRARVSHGIVLKMADLSILMEPTLLLKNGQLQYPTTKPNTRLSLKRRIGEWEWGTGNGEWGMGNF